MLPRGSTDPRPATQPETVKVRRRQPTQVKRDADASALRQAIQRSDPKALDDVNKLPDADTSERQRFLFYQDEGGIRATGDDNEDLGVIYYLVGIFSSSRKDTADEVRDRASSTSSRRTARSKRSSTSSRASSMIK